MSFDMDFTFMSRYTDGFELNFRGRSYRFHDPDANRKEFVVTGLNRLPPLPSKKMYRIIVKNLTFQVMNNPGTNLAETYVKLPVADRFVVYEDKQGNYGAYKALPYMGNYATTRFVHIVYNVTAAQVSGDVNTAIAKHAGGVYLTNLKLPNPYAKLPSFWPQQVAAVAAKNG
ncbi:unnamed protein product, partial [Mesorhabditis belari]|uniref:Uncharacterized protein n=1 Tax=Mesorhabditis belari TaxID=2138241 RepID=A0AAF3F1Q2_9BILA